MHELGIMFQVVRSIESIAQKNGLREIAMLVLQVGELASVVPQYLEACYPAAVDGTILQNTQLKIEIIPANALCQNCRTVYHLLEQRECPECGTRDRELLSGKEFNIKEIIAC